MTMPLSLPSVVADSIVFLGELERASFADFAHARARRLGLQLTLTWTDPDRVTAQVTGHPDLIDAFEAACSLGPSDCLVRTVTRR